MHLVDQLKNMLSPLHRSCCTSAANCGADCSSTVTVMLDGLPTNICNCMQMRGRCDWQGSLVFPDLQPTCHLLLKMTGCTELLFRMSNEEDPIKKKKEQQLLEEVKELALEKGCMHVCLQKKFSQKEDNASNKDCENECWNCIGKCRECPKASKKGLASAIMGNDPHDGGCDLDDMHAASKNDAATVWKNH